MREILIEKFTKPDFEEKVDGRTLQHWYNKQGWCERKNNLPAIIVTFKHETLCHFHKDGWHVKSIFYTTAGTEIPSPHKMPGDPLYRKYRIGHESSIGS